MESVWVTYLSEEKQGSEFLVFMNHLDGTTRYADLKGAMIYWNGKMGTIWRHHSVLSNPILGQQWAKFHRAAKHNKIMLVKVTLLSQINTVSL